MLIFIMHALVTAWCAQQCIVALVLPVLLALLLFVFCLAAAGEEVKRPFSTHAQLQNMAHMSRRLYPMLPPAPPALWS